MEYKTPLRFFAFVLGLMLPLGGYGANPEWWTTRGVLDTTKAPSDFAAANIGQVKTIAKKAYDELESKLGDAGPALDALIDSWDTTTTANDYAAVNQGQVKTVAALFYDRLAEVGYTGQPLAPGQIYPWTTTPDDDASYTWVNLGQLKYLFSFDVPFLDTDEDGLPDIWELQYWNTLSNTASADSDSDGVNNLTEYLQGRNPTKGAVADSGGAVGLSVYQPAN